MARDDDGDRDGGVNNVACYVCVCFLGRSYGRLHVVKTFIRL